MAYTLVGKVLKSEVKNTPSPDLPTTTIFVKPGKGQKVPYHPFVDASIIEMKVGGRHILGGRRIRADYECSTETLWVRHYDIIDGRGHVLHSEDVS